MVLCGSFIHAEIFLRILDNESPAHDLGTHVEGLGDDATKVEGVLGEACKNLAKAGAFAGIVGCGGVRQFAKEENEEDSNDNEADNHVGCGNNF